MTDETTDVTGDLPVDLLTRMFASMIQIRLAEERLASLIEGGEVHCPCHLYIGQEAIATGVCAALERSDYVWGGHRSHGHYLAKGGNLDGMFAEILGRTSGCSRGRGGSMHLFAPESGILGTVPLVAATIPLAAGTALASRLRADGRVSVAFFGDGAIEEGHTHETMNLAALYRLPLIFVCENNFYASHMALLERRAADNIVQTAAAHGMPGEQLDGNDISAVYAATVRAVARARAGEGPTLLECRTYRWRGHVGPSWDMDVGVKRKDELSEWQPRDPIARLKSMLVQRGVGESTLAAIETDARVDIDRAVEGARQAPFPGEQELLEHVYYREPR
jgi:acetoin:2,6-dichlorophenolindophenol oxidoreductase subunit alpha